jgi:cephalosporin-C deacetylase-like acetyl esterase
LDPLFQENKTNIHTHKKIKAETKTRRQDVQTSSRRVESYPMNYSGQMDAKAKGKNMSERENEQTAPPRRVETYPMN